MELLVEIRDSVALVALNNPGQANAYNQAILQALSQTLLDLQANDSVEALVLHSGKSKHFCAGAQRGELRNRGASDGLHLLARQVFGQLAQWPHPTIAAISGAAVGGGLELALACDMRLGCTNNTFAFPETSLGLIPAAGGCFRAAQLLGPALAKQMILFGRTLKAHEALECGLISEIAANSPALLDSALRWAKLACSRDQLANQLAKAAINICADQQAVLACEGASQAVLYQIKKGAG